MEVLLSQLHPIDLTLTSNNYSVHQRISLENDLAPIIDDVRENSIKAGRVIIYCGSLNVC